MMSKTQETGPNWTKNMYGAVLLSKTNINMEEENDLSRKIFGDTELSTSCKLSRDPLDENT